MTKLVLSLLLAAGLLQNQAQVRTLLESSDIKDQSWGALMAAQSKMRDLEPQIRKNLEAHLQQRAWQEQLVVDTALDAYIQCGIDSLPLDLLQSLYSRSPSQVLILLSRPERPKDPAVDAFMLKVLNQEGRPGIEWFVAADFLLSHGTPGFLASSLRGLKIRGTVLVCDAGKECMRNHGAGFGGSNPGSSLDPGYPPWPVYTLARRLDAPVRIPGRPSSNVGYHRGLEAEGVHWCSPSAMGADAFLPPTDSERLSYVAAAAGSLQLPLKGDETLTVQWRSRSAYTTAVDQFRQGIVQRYSDMLRQLQGAGLLTPDEAAALATPRLEIVVEDKRTVRAPL